MQKVNKNWKTSEVLQLHAAGCRTRSKFEGPCVAPLCQPLAPAKIAGPLQKGWDSQDLWILWTSFLNSGLVDLFGSWQKGLQTPLEEVQSGTDLLETQDSQDIKRFQSTEIRKESKDRTMQNTKNSPEMTKASLEKNKGMEKKWSEETRTNAKCRKEWKPKPEVQCCACTLRPQSLSNSMMSTRATLQTRFAEPLCKLHVWRNSMPVWLSCCKQYFCLQCTKCVRSCSLDLIHTKCI